MTLLSGRIFSPPSTAVPTCGTQPNRGNMSAMRRQLLSTTSISPGDAISWANNKKRGFLYA